MKDPTVRPGGEPEVKYVSANTFLFRGGKVPVHRGRDKGGWGREEEKGGWGRGEREGRLGQRRRRREGVAEKIRREGGA